jgi:hypothetical protein
LSKLILPIPEAVFFKQPIAEKVQVSDTTMMTNEQMFGQKIKI